jgi:hypothetical protein
MNGILLSSRGISYINRGIEGSRRRGTPDNVTDGKVGRILIGLMDCIYIAHRATVTARVQ